MKTQLRFIAVLALMAFASLSLPAHAQTYTGLTGPEVQDTIGSGYRSVPGSGSDVYKDTNSTREQALPDVVTTSTVEVSPATSDTRDVDTRPANPYGKGFWNERCQTIAAVNADCTVLSLNPGSSGSPAVNKTITTVTPGGIETIATCDRSTATIGHDATSGFSVTFSNSSRDGSC